MFSHKLCRWLVPFAMIAIFLSNLFLLESSFLYTLIFALQLAFYALVAAGLLFKGLRGITALKIPVFFTMVNLSILVAWYRYLTNEKYVVWEATKR